MKISVTKVAKKSPLDTVLDELDGMVNDSIHSSFLKGKDEDEPKMEEMVEEEHPGLEVVESEEHGEPDGDELPEDLKKALIEALSRE